jgi:hypothetical protein
MCLYVFSSVSFVSISTFRLVFTPWCLLYYIHVVHVLFLLFVLLHKVVSYTPWQYEEHVECLLRRRHCLHGSLWFVGGINVARILVLSIVCQMLPVSLDSPFMIASSIFYDVYLECLIDFYGRGLLFFCFLFFLLLLLFVCLGEGDKCAAMPEW